MNLITKFMDERLNEKQRQWAWFIILWCFGLASVMIIGGIIKTIIAISK